tara:strand:+ start:295 stop:702 length:408 start_codon:yes stop_codon:yes gene_type:complete
MASELKVDKITGVSTAGSIDVVGEGNSTTTNLQQGLAKQWLKFNQDTPAITNSFNVASVTDDSTGNYNIITTNNWSNANMCVTCMAQAEAANNDKTEYVIEGGNTTTSSIARRDVENNAARDQSNSNTICTGDLA